MGTYELWGLSTGNAIAELKDERKARELVRELLSMNWRPEDLSLGLPDGTTVLEGAELVAWLG